MKFFSGWILGTEVNRANLSRVADYCEEVVEREDALGLNLAEVVQF
jgi:hypothetical protein